MTVTELGRNPSAAIARAVAGDRVVVTRHGVPVAVMTPIEAGIELVLAGSERFARLRRDARDQLDAGEAVPLGERRR